MKILLADDEPIARTMLEHWLTGWGHEVVSAKDGQAALSVLQQDPEVRLAVLDWVMPKLDGVDVCREVRRSRPGVGEADEPLATGLPAVAHRANLLDPVRRDSAPGMGPERHALPLDHDVTGGLDGDEHLVTHVVGRDTPA